jgi:hypothetical protein
VQARSRVKRSHGASSVGEPTVAKPDEDVDGLTDLTGAAALARATDPTGALPQQHGQTAPGYVLSPLAKMALARARMRTVVPLDFVQFVAACPACGADCEWTQEREETRVRSYQNCPCTT